MTRIIVYGSNSVVLAGLTSILNSQADLQIVGSFLDDVSPIALSDFSADLLLLERSPTTNFSQSSDEDIQWLEQWISTADFEIVGVLLTDSLRTEELEDYLHHGFKGFLPRLINTDEIVAAIHAVSAGLIVIHPALVALNDEGWSGIPALANHPVGGNTSAITPLPQLDISLTSREVEILQLLKAGLDNKTIASTLQISKHTVKFHISSILAKLNVSSRTEAVTLGLRQGLISL
ncbi:helix-turn-helix domain-containing protein [Vacuolonema iberomarrocanum]|uniref:helix-turn-helix transcriptional regulator n=1 Tax=Vacuolonema iberomarrocanum TaxID=3454632 RepID=UPI0019F6063C|nr:response regulator transcription factor [filamentous cyanobacterium LEGE 07170]